MLMANVPRSILHVVERADPREVYRLELEAHRRRVTREERAQERARALLLSLLSEGERQRYADSNEVIVTGSHGSRYKVTHGYQGNVYRIDEGGNVLASYCAHPRMHIGYDETLPMEDAMIAQILTIRTNEEEFLRIANLM